MPLHMHIINLTVGGLGEGGNTVYSAEGGVGGS